MRRCELTQSAPHVLHAGPSGLEVSDVGTGLPNVADDRPVTNSLITRPAFTPDRSIRLFSAILHADKSCTSAHKGDAPRRPGCECAVVRRTSV